MTKKQDEEIDLAKRLLDSLGYFNFNLYAEPRDPPDVVAVSADHCVGIEVTKLHTDDLGNRHGSRLRAEEEKRAKESRGRSYTFAGQPNYLSAFQARLGEKIKGSQKCDPKKYHELWLLVVAQLPQPGASASTMVLSPFINIAALNRCSHDLLLKSRYHAAYFHLLQEGATYKWCRSNKWTVARAPHQQSPSRQGLWFKDILRDPDWLRNPNAKARQEAHESIHELPKIKRLRRQQ